jgi:hypothetical protein
MQIFNPLDYLLSEGVAKINEKLDRRGQKLKKEIQETSETARPEGRASRQGNIHFILCPLTPPIPLGRDGARSGQEILAAIKVSYAELDRRIATLEKDFLDLKHRVEKIESRSIP